MKLLLLSLFFLAFAADAQITFDKKYKDCNEADTCFYCGDTPAMYQKNIAGKIQWSLEHGAVKWMSTSGRMYYEIQVDSTGRSCVLAVKDDAHMTDVRENVRRCINNLRDWVPAELDRKPINSTLIMELYFVGSEATVRFVKPKDIH